MWWCVVEFVVVGYGGGSGAVMAVCVVEVVVCGVGHVDGGRVEFVVVGYGGGSSVGRMRRRFNCK
jgi:hypothetical protein